MFSFLLQCLKFLRLPTFLIRVKFPAVLRPCAFVQAPGKCSSGPALGRLAFGQGAVRALLTGAVTHLLMWTRLFK